MDYKHEAVGTVVRVEEAKQITQYLKKRQFVIRYTDTDFTGKLMEQLISFDTINSSIQILDPIHENQVVKVEFYISGKDYEKDGVTKNFTSLSAFNIEILMDPQNDTKEDKEAVITPLGKVYKVSEASDEELLKFMVDIPDITVNTPNGSNPLGDIKKQDAYDDLPF